MVNQAGQRLKNGTVPAKTRHMATPTSPSPLTLDLSYPVADLGVRMGGMNPPHQPKPNDFGPKISLNFDEDLFFFFFGDHLILGGKNVWISDFGRKISLNFGEDLFFLFFFFFLETTWFWAEKTFEYLSFVKFCAQNFYYPPPPKFSGSATAHTCDTLELSKLGRYTVQLRDCSNQRF